MSLLSLLFEILKARYEDEQKIKESLESKAANLIAFIAIIVTLYTSFFSGILTKQTVFPSAPLFWTGIILYLISGSLSLLALLVRWRNGPIRITREFIDDCGKSSISKKQLEGIFQTDYVIGIEDMSAGNDGKARFLYWSFVFAFLGIIFTVLLITISS